MTPLSVIESNIKIRFSAKLLQLLKVKLQIAGLINSTLQGHCMFFQLLCSNGPQSDSNVIDLKMSAVSFCGLCTMHVF